MGHVIASIDRLLVGLVGLALLAAAAVLGGLAAGLPAAETIADALSSGSLESTVAEPWFPAAALFGGIVLAALGAWLAVANLRRRGFNIVRSRESGDLGSVTLSLNRIAAAVASVLEEREGVTRVPTRVAMDRRRPTMEWTIDAEAGVPLLELAGDIDQAEEDLRVAIPGVEVDSRFRVRLAPVPTESSRNK